VRRLSDGSLTVSVAAARSLAGRKVELQRFAGARWTTIERALLDGQAYATLARPRTRPGVCCCAWR
jgi:hypothetical protein